MHSAGVVEANRDLALCSGNILHPHVFHRAIVRETGWGDVHLYASPEDVLERIALDRGALRYFLDEKDVPTFLAQGRCVLDAKADDSGSMRIDADRER